MRHTGSVLFVVCVLGSMGCGQLDADGDVDSASEAVGEESKGEIPVLRDEQTSAPTCSGRPGRLRGRSRQRVRAGGLNRDFTYYAPASLDPNQPTPLVIVPHGYTMNDQQMYDITEYAALAEREGFAVAFPDAGPGTGAGPWNVGSGICGLGSFVNGGNNDQAFVDAMIDFADADRCIDREHVFMNGFSMGGYFSNESGCVNPKIKGIAPHSGGTHNLSRCIKRELPVLIMHFNPDNLITYNCGTDARNKWAQRNGCTLANPEVREVLGGRCEYYQNCNAGAQVAMCTFQPPRGSGELIRGHGWAGGTNAGTGGDFAIPGTARATELAWSFFKEYGW